MLKTRNEGWGFYGTMGGEAQAAWPIAMKRIGDATGEGQEAVRSFLDSKMGRHFADEVLDRRRGQVELAEAIHQVVTDWNNRRVGARTSREYGIPRMLPYLVGWVCKSYIDSEI